MFEIRAGKTAPCELVNEAGEVIAEGTNTHCQNVKRRLCKHDMKPTDNWLIDRCSKCGEEHV